MKAVLRPYVLAVREWVRPNVFRVRRWRPAGFRDQSPVPEGPVRFQFLWREVPPTYTQLFLDGAFGALPDYPVAQTKLLPLVDVQTRTGNRYLSLAHCPVTGLVFHSRLPGLDWQNDFYAQEWDKTSRAGPSMDPQQFMRTRTNKVEQLARPFLKRRSRVLDIGCGYGDQLFYFMEAGHELVGVEPSRHRAEFARQFIKGEILNCPAESEALHKQLHDREGHFDLIYLNHVLEHLHNPVAVLKVLRPLLADDGILLIGVPDLFSESMMNFACSIIHTHAFSANALRNILGACGYRPCADRSFPGYNYVLFEKAPASAPQHDALTGKVVLYACAHFDLLKLRRRRDVMLSILSQYTGQMETGLRVLSLPNTQDMTRISRMLHQGDGEGLREFFPITIVMPFEKPTIWQK